MSVEVQGLRSDMLMFLDTEEAELRRRKQGSKFEFTDFTLPSRTLAPPGGSAVGLGRAATRQLRAQTADPGNPAEAASDHSVAKASVRAPAQVT